MVRRWVTVYFRRGPRESYRSAAEAIMPRSRHLVLLMSTAIFWLLAGLCMILTSSMSLMMWHFGGFREQVLTLPAGLQMSIFDNYGTMAAVQLGGSLLLVAAAVAVIRLRPYGRRLLQGACIVAIGFLVAFGYLWIESLADSPPLEVHRTFWYVFFAMSLIMGTLALTPLILTLWVLSRPDIKDALSRRDEMRKPSVMP